MDTEFLKKLDEKQRGFRNAANETDEQFRERYQTISQTEKSNIKDMQSFVDQKIFSGQLETSEQEKHLDFAHDYVLKGIKEDVRLANNKVYQNIQVFGKAEPTEKDKERKKSVKGALFGFTNRVVQEFKGKEASYQQDLYDDMKAVNKNVDMTSAVEMHRLEKYNHNLMEYFQRADKNSTFNKLAKKRLGSIADANKKKAKDKELYAKYCFSMVPFVKSYKKGWFGRYYTLDGNRMKFKDGELKPDEYNKRLLEGLTLETRDDQGLDKKTLKKNRDQKAEVLKRLTKEMIEYGDKFDPKKLTDLYVSNHIVELQEYYARLNAFQRLVTDNMWFFLGKDVSSKGKRVTLRDAADPAFGELVQTHILDMAAPISNFLESHLASHGIKSTAEFKGKKNGFRVDDDHEFVLLGESDEDILSSKETDLKEMHSSLMDVQEKSERFYAFGRPYAIVESENMQPAEKKEYERKLLSAKDEMDSGMTGQLLYNRLTRLRYRQKQPLTRDLNRSLKKELGILEDNAKKSVENYNKTETDEKKKLPVIPYASMSNIENMDDTVLLDLQYVQEKMQSADGSIAYMYYGPEMDHIYGKMYAAVRLQAELLARKKAINQKLKLTRIREIEKELKEKKRPKVTREEWAKELAKIKKDNLKTMSFTCKNPYGKFMEGYMAEERLKRAETEYDEIAAKVEYTKQQIDICKKTMRYFLSKPEERLADGKDYDVIKGFLEKEKLGYMFKINRVADFDDMLDEALDETNAELEKEAGKDAVGVQIKKTVWTPKKRAARIHQVRSRGRLAKETDKVVKEKISIPVNETKVFLDLVRMSPAELSKLNFKGDLSMATKEEREKNLDAMNLFHCATRKQSVFNPKFYKDRVQMLLFFENLKKQRLIPQKSSFVRFMADIEIKISLLLKWNNNFTSALVRQRNSDYAFLNTEALEDMSVHSLELTRDNLIKKADEQKALADAGDAKAKAKEADYRKLAYFVDLKVKQERAKLSFTDLTEEAYNHEMNERMEELEVDIAQKEDFFDADATFVKLKKLMAGEKGKEFKKTDEDKYREKIQKDKSYFDKEKNLEQEALGLLVRLREIPMDQRLTDAVTRITRDDYVPEDDEILSLLRYGRTIFTISSILHADKMWGAAEGFIKLRAYFERKENKEYLTEIQARMKVLDPLYKVVNRYMECKGMTGCMVIGKTGVYRGSDEIDFDKQEEYRSELLIKGGEMLEAAETLQANIEKADEILTQDYSEKLFAMVHEAGSKLDLAHMKDWEKIFKKIKKDGYYNKKDSDNQENKWMKAAATQILDRWPQSFEDFYAERAKLDTGKALDETFKKIARENGTAFVEDTAHAAEISAVISKKETMMYTGLNMNKRRELDEALTHSGYDTRIFKYLLKDVETNGVGEPVTSLARINRGENNSLVQRFLNRNKKTEKEADTSDKNCANKRFWNNQVVRLLRDAVQFKITSEMTEPAYIKKNFERLYSQTRQFAALKQIYEKEKDLLNDPAVLRRNEIDEKTVVMIKNAFGPETRSVYAMFFDMIEAYAHMYFVDREGHFDIGLSAQEMYGKDGAPLNPEKNKEKINAVLKEREAQFKRCGMRVAAELDREVLATKAAEADEVNKALNSIQIDMSHHAFRMVQKEGFAGKLDDVNLLTQSPKLAAYVKERSRLQEQINGVREQIRPLYEQEKLTKEEGKIEEHEAILAQIAQIEMGLSERRTKLGHIEYKIEQHTKQSKIVYDRFDECHDEDGNLQAVYTDESGITVNRIDKYIEYQASVYKDIKRIYDEFKSFAQSVKKEGNEVFTAQRIVHKFKQNEMADKLRDLKKLDLYLGLLEVDRKSFKDPKAKTDVMDMIGKRIETFKKNNKKAFAKVKEPGEIAAKKQNELYAEEMTGAYQFMKEVLKDMDSKDNPVQLLHDYVQLIYLTLKSYGVSPTGEIEEDKIREVAEEGKYTPLEIKGIAYDEADKIGDAHIQLERDINKRLGIDKKNVVRKESTKKKK